MLGATDKELADFFETTEQTINNWKHDFPEFFESIKKGKEQADSNVADRLYQRAMGYEHDDVHIANYQGEAIITPIRKYYPPDTTAAIFWLKNRQKDNWRDRQEVDHTLTAKSGVLRVGAELTREDWETQAKDNRPEKENGT